MFSRLLFGEKGEPVILEASLDPSTYERFESFMVQNHVEERDAVIKILERGMTNYWVHEYKQMKTSYMQLKKIFEECKKDNENLNTLQTENRQLREMLQKRGSEYEV